MTINRRTFILFIERNSRMKMARRTFLIGAGVFAASPVLANLLSTDNEVAPALRAAAEDGPDLVFKIDGWSARDSGAGDEMWFSVNRSWRAAWR
jgi:hypothetical protein